MTTAIQFRTAAAQFRALAERETGSLRAFFLTIADAHDDGALALERSAA